MSFNNPGFIGQLSGSKGCINSSPVTFNIGDSSVRPNISYSNNGMTPYPKSIQQPGVIWGGGASITTPVNRTTDFNFSGYAHGADKKVTAGFNFKF